MLASDLNNPEFAGAKDPDRALHVVFYTKPVKNDFASAQQARPIFENVDFIRITTPGNVLNIVDTPARPDHQERFPRQWQAYKNRVGTDVQQSGTPITEWPRITPAQAEEMKALKFYTVESIASAGDAQLQGIGMVAGQSVFAFRDDAKRFLSVADADAKNSAADKKLAEAEAAIAQEREALRVEREEYGRSMRQMQEQVQALLASAGAPAKRGRKPKLVTQE
jgi:hypothetical protein